jgi:hypothetical protein
VPIHWDRAALLLRDCSWRSHRWRD